MHFLKLALLACVLVVSFAQKQGTRSLRGLLAGDEGRELDDKGYSYYKYYDESKCKDYVKEHKEYYAPYPYVEDWGYYVDYCKYKDYEYYYYVKYYKKCKEYAMEHAYYYWPKAKSEYHYYPEKHDDSKEYEDKEDKHKEGYGNRKEDEEFKGYPEWCTYAYHYQYYTHYSNYYY